MTNSRHRHITAVFSSCLLLLAACSTSGTDPSTPPSAKKSNGITSKLFSLSPKSNDLLTDLRHDFQINHDTKREEVQAQIAWYMQHQTYLNGTTESAAPYLFYIREEIKKRGMPGELVLLPIVESAYNPFAYSRVGAAGLWQLMPGTASGYGVKQDWWFDGRRDIVASTKAALDYLQYLHNFFGGDWLLAMAAYNSGEGTVDNAIKRNARLGKPTDFWHLQLPKQTQAYIPRMLALASIIDQPKAYPVDLPHVENAPYIAEVDVGSQIDLQHAAKMAGISLENLYKLNPGFNRWATDPDGPHRLLLPVDRVDRFKQKLAELPRSARVTWRRYTVKAGDTVGYIANKFKTSASMLEQVNDLKNDMIQVGQDLFIPDSSNKIAQYALQGQRDYVETMQDVSLPGPQRTNHLVHKGDSLWSIANKYKVKISEIRFWNHINKGESLQPGQKLIIWTAKPQANRYVQYVTKQLPPTHYTVKSGDTLAKIANLYRVKISNIKAQNKLKNDIIHPGQSLRIPPKTTLSKASTTPTPHVATHYTVVNGDSLGKIAKQYRLSVEQIRQWNSSLAKNDIIHPGDKLTLYVQG